MKTKLINIIRKLFHPRGCADCGMEIGRDTGPSDGWQLEDGRTVCQDCCGKDLRQKGNTL